jgi:hypothetical protein
MALGARTSAKEKTLAGRSVSTRRHFIRSRIQGLDENGHCVKLGRRQRKRGHAPLAIFDHICYLIYADASKPAIVAQRRSTVRAFRIASVAQRTSALKLVSGGSDLGARIGLLRRAERRRHRHHR